MKNKGFVLTDVIVATFCLMVLIIPIIRCMNIINKNLSFPDSSEVSILIDDEAQRIKESEDLESIKDDFYVDDFRIKTDLHEKINENTMKFKTEIYKDKEIISEFYIIKVFKN